MYISSQLKLLFWVHSVYVFSVCACVCVCACACACVCVCVFECAGVYKFAATALSHTRECYMLGSCLCRRSDPEQLILNTSQVFLPKTDDKQHVEHLYQVCALYQVNDVYMWDWCREKCVVPLKSDVEQTQHAGRLCQIFVYPCLKNIYFVIILVFSFQFWGCAYDFSNIFFCSWFEMYAFKSEGKAILQQLCPL